MAAKAIQISNDGGTTWITLPGSQGSFNANGESIEDTILGYEFASNESGLVNWGVSGEAIWKGFAGYIAELKAVGSTTGFTTEAMTVVTGKTFQIDDAAKEIWDRSVTLVIWDNGAPVAAADIENVDYLFGRVTFTDAYTVLGSITANSGSYFPTASMGCAQSYNLTMTADAIDETCFNTAQANDGRRVFKAGLKTVALELTGVYSPSDDFKTMLTDRDEVIIEIDPAGDQSSMARGFFKLITQSQSGAVGALEEETLNFQLNVPDETTNPIVEIPFGWQHTGATTLNGAIQWLITSWEDGLNTYDVRYLPQGTIGQSPLDGAKGDFVVTDISLSGALDAMNVFQAEMQGTGAFTIV